MGKYDDEVLKGDPDVYCTVNTVLRPTDSELDMIEVEAVTKSGGRAYLSARSFARLLEIARAAVRDE